MSLLIVSNRLPVAIQEEKGDIQFKKTVGGLAVGLESYLNGLKKGGTAEDYTWVGWPGEIEGEFSEEMITSTLQQKSFYPVFLTEEEMDTFYNGFCNDTIWPLFHYFTSYVSYKNEWWESYKKVNEKYAEAVLKVAGNDDVVWIQDYHLMLLPEILKKKNPNLKIGFFLHIPFPVFEVFRLLPAIWRQKILQGLLGSDLIGFHTYDYSRYFLDCVQRILGYDNNMGIISAQSRKVKVRTFPMGIDYNHFYDFALSDVVQIEKTKIAQVTSGLKLILSIDRLDYTKGILRRLQSYEAFLEAHEEWRRKVMLVLVVVPSRTDVERYMEMKSSIDEIVGKINGKFSAMNWSPILYQYKALSPERLSALYNMSDVALITPLRDGMNLIAKEYIASRTDQTGVLILSEMAGAAQELGEAIIINPNHRQEICNALEEALSMPAAIQKSKTKIMQNRLKSYSVEKWAKEFLESLEEFTLVEQEERKTKYMTFDIRNKIIQEFHTAKKKLLFLDYDGTLVPFSRFPLSASPDQGVKELLRQLALVPDADVVIISGRDKEILEEWLDIPNVHIVAEHGIWIRENKNEWKMMKAFKNDWKESILPVLKHYSDRLPGAFIEEKEFSIAWHYRLANAELAKLQSRELLNNLTHLTANMGLQILQGNKVIEVRNGGADKGAVALYFREKQKYDFVMAMGDDTTDEDLFDALGDKDYTIKVGARPTKAQYLLDNYSEVRSFLSKFVE